MFSSGFEKLAVSIAATKAQRLGEAAGKVISAPLKAVGAIGVEAGRAGAGAASGFVKGVKAGFPPKRLSPSMKFKPEAGASIASRRVMKASRKGQLNVTRKSALDAEKKNAKEQVLERHKRMKQGPSFVQKHPLLTAAGAYMGYKYLTSPPDAPAPEPQVYRPAY